MRRWASRQLLTTPKPESDRLRRRGAGGEGPRRPAEISSRATVDALWLETLQRIVARAAHEVKGALNGVSVNLEVVRSRAEKPDTPASGVVRYASVASEQLGTVIGMTEALLALARPMHEPVDAALLVRRLGALLVPAARAGGGELQIVEPMAEAPVAADATVVRIVVGSALLAVVEAPGEGRARCRVIGGDPPGVRVESASGPLHIDEAVLQAAHDARIQIVVEQAGISISFPRDGGRAVEHS